MDQNIATKKKVHFTIFEYVDYRFFLTDYFNHQKKHSRGFTFRSFAQKAGLSASLLKDILSKRQNLTASTMSKYAGAMGLSPKETAYFEALVGFNNTTTYVEKNKCFTEMIRLRGRSATIFLDLQQYEYFSQWYHAVVRELMTHGALGDDAEAISRCIVPSVSPAKVRKSIALLKELSLVYLDSGGSWRATDKVVSSEYEIKSVALKNYHIGMLEKAIAALDTCPSEEREFQGLTLGTGRETFLRMKERIRSFTDELLAMAAADNAKTDEVYQINVQIFPFTRRENNR